jgi:ParB family chromosome partitioning protein
MGQSTHQSTNPPIKGASMFSARTAVDDGKHDDIQARQASATTDDGYRAVQKLRELPVDVIEPNPLQPRRHFNEAALKALAGSVSEHGILQPVLVRPRPDGKYEIVAGERRWRAAQIAGRQTIPTLVSPYEDPATLEVALIENMAREDLNPVEEARACATLAKELGLTYRQVADRVGRNVSVVSNLIRLLNLSKEILGLLERGELSEGHGRALLTARVEERPQLARAAIEESWTVQALEARARASRDGAPDSVDVPGPRHAAALTVAEAWGELLRYEVHVRPMAYGRVRLEVRFESPEAAIAAAGRLAEAVAKGSQGR